MDSGAIDVSACRILVADPGSATRDLTCSYLESAGFSQITTAANGIEALRQAAAADPDLIVLESALPGMDGLEVCRRVTRGDPRRVPVLIQSMFSASRDRAAAFAAGATDFVTKPVAGADLVARIALHLTNRLLLRRLEAYRARVTAELTIARAMQADLLPQQDLLDRLAAARGVRIAAHVVSCSELGGDAWGVLELDAARIAIFTADMSGHGVTAALNSVRLDVLIKSLSHAAQDPAGMLRELTLRLHALLPAGHFATMFYGVIDLTAGTLTYATAAAPCPILIARPGEPPTVLPAAGLPLGATRRAAYSNRVAPFAAGAALILYSDALIETADASGALWTEQDVCRCAAGHGTALATLQQLIDAFQVDRAGNLQDDLTIVVVKREEFLF